MTDSRPSKPTNLARKVRLQEPRTTAAATAKATFVPLLTMTEANDDETGFLLVVEMNRPRLNKILSLVQERRSIVVLEEEQKEEARHQTSSVAKVPVTLVPCLASIASYEDENNNIVRYLSNVVCQDGSPMTKYFDDELFRDNLRKVLLIGYEWQEKDTDKMGGYFKANQLDVGIECIAPNPEFESLQEEMDAFRSLDEGSKERCSLEGTMGPSKMARWVVEAIERIENEKIEEARRKEEEVEKAAMESASSTVEDPLSQEAQPEPADPDQPRYACRICRTILFGENHLAQDHLQNLHSFKKSIKSTTTAACQSIFCSESVLAWLSPSGQDIEGKLACPKCLHKVGHWRWAGAQCSCGTWVTPAIQIPVSKVDVVPPESQIHGIALLGVINPQFVASPLPS